jgi:nitric oxide reductase large subunit
MGAAAVTLGLIFWIVIMGVGAALYFLPTIIAVTQHRRNAALVAVINVLLGWSFLGWIVALVMALTKDPEPVQVVHVHQQFVQPSPPLGADTQSVPERRPPGHDLMER